MAPQSPLHTHHMGLAPVDSADLSAARGLPGGPGRPMDHRLQLRILNRDSHVRGHAHSHARSAMQSEDTAPAAVEEVPVIARVTSPDDWAVLPGVASANTIGKAADGSWIVTGRLHADQVEAVHAHDVVLSLKAAQPTHSALNATISEMGLGTAAVPGLPDPPVPGLLPPWVQHAHRDGEGVIVGIVDFGCDYRHRNLRETDGRTRLLALWDQSGQPNSPAPYGAMYTAPQIDAALATDDPYQALGYAPAKDDPTKPAESWGTHGTHVMDIAAGNGLGSKQPGVAPKASLIFVDAKLPTPVNSPDQLNHTLGSTVQLLEAVNFIFTAAGNRPCVVNLSLGTNGGPHDGSSLVEQGLDAMVNAAPYRAVVIAAGNSQQSGTHTSGTVPASGDCSIGWRITTLTTPGFETTPAGGEVELWYPGRRRLSVALVAPDGTEIGPVGPNESLPYGLPGKPPAVFIVNRLGDPNNHDNVIGIWIAMGAPKGEWTIRLRSLDDGPVDYHAWIERFDAGQAQFTQPVASHMLGSISTGHATIIVGSHDAHSADTPISFFSSAGPTRDGRLKPDLSAPGHRVKAAWSRTETGVIEKYGTSMAAPAVTGLIALIYARSVRKGLPMDTAMLRERLLRMVRRTPPEGTDWHPQHGHGRASAAAILEAMDGDPAHNPDFDDWYAAQGQDDAQSQGQTKD
ncbi:S8 family peptidase [Azospirillum sp. TSH100]|uniref:S8 family peptidase n=1 Tax=Azospirillum sp. TSH100 TaxID=652764 RepID=UPI000D655E60|nr:S8 family peptidase [Azospirillum sp. TSH100]QCG86282.1 peptidase S8/S53 subtilisin kexin sedolisin [Azospirillum sp. TSH100]